MTKIETLRQLQLVSIYIYKELLTVCEKNGIRLYLLGGTLIGAIRHKGFIPWDDDIDVCMSRPDYNKLLRVTEKKIGERCRIVDPATDDKYRGVVPIVVYEQSAVESGQFKEKEELKIAISIFVYDGAPSHKISQVYYYSKLYILRAKHALCRANFKNANTHIARVVGPILTPFFSVENVYKYKNKILKWQQKFPYEFSEYVSTNVDSGSWKEVFPKYTFENSTDVYFEGIKSHAFSNYHEHLTKYYGDYMKLPPIEEQHAKHSFNAQIEDSFEF